MIENSDDRKTKIEELQKEIAYMTDVIEDSDTTHKQYNITWDNRMKALKELNNLLNNKPTKNG